MSTNLAPSAQQIGTRFSIVTAIPTATLLIFVVALLLAGAPENRPNMHAALEALGAFNAVDIALLVFAGTALSLLLHPFQVALVKLLEGYWPPYGPLGVIRQSSEARHQSRRRWLEELQVRREALNRWEQRHPDLIQKRRADAFGQLKSFPFAYDRVLGTRLGNALRAAEDLAGARYGLESIEVIPRLYPLAEPTMIELIEDARNQMDVMASFVLVWLLATAFGLLVLAPYGVWLAVPAVTYLMAWLCYRACVIAAVDYGATLMWAIDLYRFELIEQLRYQPAADPGTERKHNRQIMAVLTGEHFLQSAPDAEPVLLYSHATSDSGHAADAGTNDATSEQRPLEQDLETSASEQGEETWSPMPSDAEVVKRSQRILEAAAFFAREAQRQRLLPDRITVCHRDTTLRRWTRRWWLRAGKPRPRPLRRRAGWQIRPYRGQGSVETPTDLSISSVTITTSGRVLFDAEWPHDIREMGTRADRSTNPPVFPIDPYENWEQLVEDILDTLRRVLKSVHGSLPVALDGDIERSRANLLKPLSTAESGASDA